MSTDFNEKVARARAAGRGPDAVALWRELLSITNVEEADYQSCCRTLAELYQTPQHARPNAAAAILEYLKDLDTAGALYQRENRPRDVARLLMLKKRFAEAMEAFKACGLPANAAHAADQGALHKEAQQLWCTFIRPADVQSDRWTGGLARFNAGRAALRAGDEEAAGTLLLEAINLLGEEADAREANRDRDGAFRCFMVMRDVGLASGAFEDAAEGYLNMARLLRLKGDRFGTVQALHELIQVAEEGGELHAAAELYREAGEYARRMGFVYADHFLVNAGRAWKRVAQEALRTNRPQGLVENALLAAVDAYNRTLNHLEVARCYQALSLLEISSARKERYGALAAELSALKSGEADSSPPSLPEYFRRRFHPVDHAVQDILAREAGVDIAAAASRLLTDPQLFDVSRRRALLLVLALDDHARVEGATALPPPLLTAQIGDARHASLVAPLMDIFRRGGVELKVAAVQACTRMKIREAIALVDAALETPPGSEVYQAGLTALRGMTFPQALDSLVRIFGHHEDRRIKETAIKNAAQVGTSEAAEFLLDIYRTNTSQMGVNAREALSAHVSEKMLGALENNRRGEPNPEVRAFIGQLLNKVRRSRDYAG